MAIIIPGAYGERVGLGGSPLGLTGNALIAVLGRGDKLSPSPVMISATAIVKTGGTGFTGTDTYYYKITAYNNQGETDQSAELSAEVVPPTTTAIALKWNLVAGAVGYKIYRSTVAGNYPASSLIATLVGPSVTYEDDDVTPAAGQPPATNTALIVAYNTPTLYFSMSSIRDNHDVDSDLGLASTIADKLGLSRLLVVSVDHTAYDVAVSEGDKTAALEVAYTAALASLETKSCRVVVALQKRPEIIALVKTHVDLMSQVENRKERVGFGASYEDDTIGEPATANSIVGNARATDDRRMLLTAPNTPRYTYVDRYGAVQAAALLDAGFTAFAAAVLKVVVGNASEQITNKTMNVFDSFDTDFTQSELEYLIQNGVTPLIQEGVSTQRVIKGCTTSLDSVEDNEINIVMADDELANRMRDIASPFVGKKITLGLLDALYEKTSKGLEQAVKETLITSSSNLEVYQDSVNPTWVIVRFLYRAMYAANVIKYEWSFDLRSGAALKRG